jgi:hypothetical protein
MSINPILLLRAIAYSILLVVAVSAVGMILAWGIKVFGAWLVVPLTASVFILLVLSFYKD